MNNNKVFANLRIWKLVLFCASSSLFMHPTLHGKVEILNSFAFDESRKKVRRNLWFSNLFQAKSGKEIVILQSNSF